MVYPGLYQGGYTPPYYPGLYQGGYTPPYYTPLGTPWYTPPSRYTAVMYEAGISAV